MTLKDKRIEWKARYDAWKESGQRVAEWCREQDINVNQMYYWVQRFKDDKISSEPDSTQWLTVQVDDDDPIPSGGSEPIFIHYGAISVEVRPGAHVGLLSDIIHVLRSQC
ncbi:IS66 family insertion sequence hypothetical protein [Salicibibacter halophilus]|uniref:IS66 family insertion sequence element accessory protein TnpB n=2 Tax=Salicibibacter halophilus TaxID=2502791 RepID=A0A514LKY6_9BACI|nr:IS66 family insertion sequence hypothetical protein [Salicibibacter halophilus]QDI90452.1 IS66 family insertion sequence hypothetical protein [Salicibibacter halophilus]QDI90509.1 IS66 family insertion sequence hypothetical protein [Salicibibacter halophilus]QDI90679.1 IS66 family insertion sequence hypothetical protein [Salicibibacter halophilus]QDI90781.1 IS66 family insertion sequence hypothetical protein [Salicibibacter halophilus]